MAHTLLSLTSLKLSIHVELQNFEIRNFEMKKDCIKANSKLFIPKYSSRFFLIVGSSMMMISVWFVVVLTWQLRSVSYISRD